MTVRQVPASTPREPGAVGREAQRRRTRAAIVEATTRLVVAGRSPSVDEIATEAEVSRRTVYLYFPTLDQLLLDATVGALSQALVESALGGAAKSDDPVASIDALVCALVRSESSTLPLGRKIIALTVDAPAGTPKADQGPRRGYRRVTWIEDALGSARQQLDADRYERLVSALTIIVGWEAMVVLRDVRGLDPEREAATLRWAATTLVRAALEPEGSPAPDAEAVRAPRKARSGPN